MRIGLVIVSHSAKLAEGVRELAAQMAPDVTIAPAGGTDDGGIGTSLEKIQAGIAASDSGDGVLLLTDLGSAVMTAEMALEFLDPEQQQRVLMADAPLVEGTVAAAVAAQTGKALPPSPPCLRARALRPLRNRRPLIQRTERKQGTGPAHPGKPAGRGHW